MAGMFPLLGNREASPILEKAYVPKPGDLQPPPRRELVAVIVNHGMGQQVPYETMESVALAIERGVRGHAKTFKPLVRNVRLGTEGKNETETELVRVELQFEMEEKIYDVHIYESYWAPLTEGKVTLKDVVAFLWGAGLNGIHNTDSGTFKRWLFGSQREFKLPRPWLYVLLFSIMLVLASLTLMNGVLTAAAASHAIAGSGGFPTNEQLAPLTSDFLLADTGVALIALGTVGIPRFKKKLTPRWVMYVEWALVIGGVALILPGGLAMPWQLLGLSPEYYCWGWFSELAKCLTGDASACPHITAAYLRLLESFPRIGGPLKYVTERQFWVAAIWGIELLAAYAGRWFLIEYVGDVAAYIAAHTVSKFWELRQQIWQTAMKVADAVYRTRTTSADESKANFLYNKIVVVGHSLGSVIGYDVLNGLLLEDGFSQQPLHIADRTRMFLTFGSPLDKTAFLFKTQKDMNAPFRAVGAASVQPMIQNYANRPPEWVNLWSGSDLISGHLDFYDPPTSQNARHKDERLAPGGADSRQNPRAVRNEADPAARTPFAAHVEYWTGDLFARELVRGITT
jgi:hypothetical protein